MAYEVFISYRRSDDPYLAHFLYDKLQSTLPEGAVFLDVLSIDPGSDFRSRVRIELERAKALLAVIGRNWYDATDDSGRRKILNEDDLLRLEIARALQRRILVMPVLASDAKLPLASDLPSDVRAITELNHLRMSADHRIGNDIKQLIDTVGRHVNAPTMPTSIGFQSTSNTSGSARARGLIAASICPPDARKLHWWRAGDTVRDISESPELVVIAPGKYRMGAPGIETGSRPEEQPQHTVMLNQPFLIGRFPVTVGEWRCFLKDRPQKAGDIPAAPSEASGSLPMVNVSWEDARAYVDWLARRTELPYRLPTEAEWEFVARAGSSTPYWWGENCSMEHANYSVGGKPGKLQPVDRFRSNPWGVSGMLGNVAEWVEDDWHATFDGAPTNGQPWYAAGNLEKVVRGGGWRANAQGIRSAARAPAFPTERADHIGFRIARSLLEGD